MAVTSRNVNEREQHMFETPLTVVGRIITDLRRRRVGDQEVRSFRMASDSRRRGADGSWEPGNTLYITVNCWGKLVTGVGAALGKGTAVIAVGHIYTSEYDDREGVRRSSLEMRATSIGPDLSQSIVRIIDKVNHAGKDADSAATAEQPAEDHAESTDADTDSDATVGGTALPLSA
jgi:single-strand DNA-binding protein